MRELTFNSSKTAADMYVGLWDTKKTFLSGWARSDDVPTYIVMFSFAVVHHHKQLVGFGVALASKPSSE